VLYDLVLEITTPLIVYISRRHGGTCKFGFELTCGMLITSPEFTSNLTGKTYNSKLFDPLDCSTKNVIYGIECTLCGLLYVGETRQTLRSRMNQHRYDARDPK
jgi:hypothetical protein